MNQSPELKQYSSVLSLIVRLFDIFIIGIASLIVYSYRFPAEELELPANYSVITLIAILIALIIFPIFNLYSSWRGRRIIRLVSEMTLAWILVLAIVIGLTFVTAATKEYSRMWFGGWAAGSLVGFYLVRIIIYQTLRLMRSHGWNQKSVLIVGAGELGQRAVAQLQQSPEHGFEVLGYLDDNPELYAKNISGRMVLGDINEIERIARELEIDEIWIALPLMAQKRVEETLQQLRHSTVTIRYIPDIFGFRLLNHGICELANMPMINLTTSPMEGVGRVIKAIEDRIIATLILILITPVLITIATLVKLTSKGPIIYKQKRHGWDGKEITIYKFRSMRVHQEDQGKVTQAQKNDSRFTPIGGFLRRSSLDELPQFINVLQGRMSIVGPRPHAIEHNEYYKEIVEDYMLRHKVKPGITGWAQVNGWRGETDTPEKMIRRVEHDLTYIDNWSLWLDLKIIVLTIFKGFINKNAY